MHAPLLPVTYLSRQRLLDALRGSRARLRLLCAPAGFGKSVLLNEFVQRLGSGRVVWLDLSNRDQSLPDLLATLATRLGLTPAQFAAPEALLKFFSSCQEPVWLVLDNVPNDLPHKVNDWFEQLLALPSSKLQLLVSCRQRPQWNLPRLKLRGELLELNHSQLALTRAECDALIDQLAPEMEASRRNDIWQQTLGWCAAVRLLLSGPGAANELSWWRQYLEVELLSSLSDDERDVLYGLAHLSRFSADLCGQLWEEQGGRMLFQRLLHQEVFFLPLDQPGGWYSMRPAVAETLRDRLSTTELNRLRLRACRVLGVVGHLNEAIDQALGADQHEVAANFMERLRLTWLYSDQHLSQLLSWREQLPPQMLGSTVRLIYLCARGLLLSGRLDESEACIQGLGRFLPQPSAEKNTRLLAHWQTLCGALEAARGNAATARQHCRAALGNLGANDWLATLLCHGTLARIAMASGEPAQAQQLLNEAVELARRQGFLEGEVLLNSDRLRLMILQGELSRAQLLLHEDMQRIEASNNRNNPALGRLLFLQGELHLLGGRLDDSEAALLAGLEQVQGCSAQFILHGYLLLAEVATRRSDYEMAQLHLHAAERRMHCGNINRACYENAIAVQNLRILASQGRWPQVLTMARELETSWQGPLSRLPPAGMPSLPQRNQLLLASAEYETGNRMQAKQRLLTLLKQCSRYQFATLMIEAQQMLVNLGFSDGQDELLDMQRRATQSDLHLNGMSAEQFEAQSVLYTKRLKDDQDELTPRELAVLRLLAEGMSNQQVSDILFISVNTVKTHAKNINTKLGAHRRTQAIIFAKAKGILA